MRGALLVVTVLLAVATITEGKTYHCYTCKSRSGRDECKDPFVYNATGSSESKKYVRVASCSSQWCGKLTEGSEEDENLVMERVCLPKAPEDQMEKCEETIYKQRKVFMCSCEGDLCNASSAPSISLGLLAIALLARRLLL